LVALLAVFACERPRAEAASGGPKRIVSLAPSVTETLFALGAGDRVVGVTRFCDHPPEVAARRKVGGLTDVDVEIVLSLKPDLVVGVQSATAAPLQRTLQSAGIRFEFVDVETLSDVAGSFQRLGTLVEAPEEARALAEALASRQISGAPDAPKVLLLFGRDPWIGAGPGTFADEMIRSAGGRNALGALDTQYPTLDAERLSTVEPDLVIDTSFGDAPAEVPGGAPVVRLDPALIRPGPRLVQAMDVFRQSIAEVAAK